MSPRIHHELESVAPLLQEEHSVYTVSHKDGQAHPHSEIDFLITEGTVPGAPDDVHYLAAVEPFTFDRLGSVRIEEYSPSRARVAVLAGENLLESGQLAALVDVAIQESKAPEVVVDIRNSNITPELLESLGARALFEDESGDVVPFGYVVHQEPEALVGSLAA